MSVARAGIKKLVMVTSHGGNSAAMTCRADLRAACGLLAVTTDGPPQCRRRDYFSEATAVGVKSVLSLAHDAVSRQRSMSRRAPWTPYAVFAENNPPAP